MDRTLLETTLARQLHWISAADNKISPVLAVDTAMMGAIAALAPNAGDWTVLTALVTTVAVILLAISLVNLFLAGFPRTHGPQGSLVFFGGITERTQDEFIEAFRRLNEEEYALDLAKQCYRNAEIAGRKYHHVRWATKALLLSFIPWSLAIYFVYANR